MYAGQFLSFAGKKQTLFAGLSSYSGLKTYSLGVPPASGTLRHPSHDSFAGVG